MTETLASCRVRVAECFLSLQGEGPSLGCPAHFVRLQGCTVGCRWCDTKYTWAKDGGEDTDLASLGRQLDELGHSDLLVITGGEPLENDALLPLVEHACTNWPRVEIETSGNRPLPPVPTNVHWNWSPKLSSVTPMADETWRHASNFERSTRYACKIVVDTEGDWDEACVRVKENKIPASRVFIMPQGLRQEDLLERARWLAPRVIEEGFRLTPRLHIELWGAKRGV